MVFQVATRLPPQFHSTDGGSIGGSDSGHDKNFSGGDGVSQQRNQQRNCVNTRRRQFQTIVAEAARGHFKARRKRKSRRFETAQHIRRRSRRHSSLPSGENRESWTDNYWLAVPNCFFLKFFLGHFGKHAKMRSRRVSPRFELRTRRRRHQEGVPRKKLPSFRFCGILHNGPGRNRHRQSRKVSFSEIGSELF